jgi:hypothetical protein
MKQSELADRIARDWLSERSPPRHETAECFLCGRDFLNRGDRFCSTRCRRAFDEGARTLASDYAAKSNARWYSLPMGKHGFIAQCAGCGRRFDSTGVRCCSDKCERAYLDRQKTITTLHKVGMEVATKRKCHSCGGSIPNWRNGRRVSKATRFCSDGCAAKSRRKKSSWALAA